jgi:hypothetical protein
MYSPCQLKLKEFPLQTLRHAGFEPVLGVDNLIRHRLSSYPEKRLDDFRAFCGVLLKRASG